jgi:hypothetical protein
MDGKPISVLKNTWGTAFIVWWAFIWRVVVALAIGGVVIYLAIRFIPRYFHVKKSPVMIIAYSAGAVYALLMTVLTIKNILNKRFKGFSVVLIKTQ